MEDRSHSRTGAFDLSNSHQDRRSSIFDCRISFPAASVETNHLGSVIVFRTRFVSLLISTPPQVQFL